MLSIIVPSFNQGRYLGEALDSIFAQQYRPLEVIVVDGASTDSTLEVLRDRRQRHPELHWISEKDDGPADAVNKGLAMMRGQWAGICSADDVYCPGAFARLMEAAAANPDVGFFYGDVAGIDADGKFLAAGNLPDFSWPAFFAIGLALPQGSIFFRTDVARAIGGWNPAYYSCDIDYWLRMLFRTPARKIPEVLSYWRIHPEQRTRADRVARIRRDYRRMLEESPDLQRAPRRLRRMAWASLRLWCFMEPGPNLWPARWDALVALLLHPAYPRYLPRARMLRLVPGIGRLRSLKKRIGRGA